MANCGMRVAMDVVVMRDYVSVYRYLGHAECDVWKRIYLERLGHRRPPRCDEKRAGGMDDFVS
jgi:hypothetical protein